MAAEVGQQFSGWSHSDLPYNDLSTQDDSIQKMILDHGSVSFGRFAVESLSWENRSVFEHNRRQEEIRKLTQQTSGLVSQKKAFFEEYYKRKAQKAKQITEATLEERSDDDTLDHSRQEDNSHAVVPEDSVDTAPSSSSEPSTGVSSSDEKKRYAPSSSSEPSIGMSSSDEKKRYEPHGLGYLTFNPLFSRITGSQGIQHEEASSTGQKQHVDGEFQCATHTISKHGLNHEAVERKVLAPKHVVSTDYGESNVAATRNILPIASLKAGLEKQKPRKSIAPAAIDRLTKGAKDPSSCLIQIPRAHLRRNSENKNSEDLKDPFHKRVEMKLRALSDRMSAERAAASSRSSSYQNADRAAVSSRSALCQNTDRVLASSKSAAQASHNSLKEVQRAVTFPPTNFYNKDLCVSHVASSNSSTTGKLATRSSVMPNSSQNNAKHLQTAQVTSKRSPRLASTSNGSQNKRKKLSTPAALDGNNRTKGSMHISAPTSARSSCHGIRPYKAAKAPRISNGRNAAVKTEMMQKSTTHEPHSVGGRNVLSKVTINGNKQNRKVISSRDGKRSNLGCKSKPREEKPRWR